jgi:hypothetical protein
MPILVPSTQTIMEHMQQERGASPPGMLEMLLNEVIRATRSLICTGNAESMMCQPGQHASESAVSSA